MDNEFYEQLLFHLDTALQYYDDYDFRGYYQDCLKCMSKLEAYHKEKDPS